MSSYGDINFGFIKLTKNIWMCILNQLNQNDWRKIKLLNKTLYQVVYNTSKLCEPIKLKDIIGKNLVETLIHTKRTINWNLGLRYACMFNNISIAKYMILRGSNNWLDALYWACKNENRVLIDLIIISRNSSNSCNPQIHELNAGLAGASESGNKELVDLMISNGAVNWNMGLLHASKNNKMELINYMIDKGGKKRYGLYGACSTNNRHIVDYLIQLGSNDWNSGLAGACHGGKKDMIDYMIDKGANNLNKGLSGACTQGSMEIINYIISKGANDWNEGLYGACMASQIKNINYMISKGATNLGYGLWAACHKNNKRIIKYMINIGATNCHCGKTMVQHMASCF